MAVKHFSAGGMKIEIHPGTTEAGAAAACAAAHALQQLRYAHRHIGVVFATGASQLATLSALTSLPDLPWGQVHGFHLDEYVGIDAHHPASFRRYLRERLTERVSMATFLPIDGNSPDTDRVCHDYVARLRATNAQLCLLGIGENGHLAFNDPAEADFEDPQAMKVVHLDDACRRQQLAEGWFETFAAVPKRALTLTIPTILKIPRLIVSVPGLRKAEIVRRTLHEPISLACPATILRTHPDVTIYLDNESASAIRHLEGLETWNRSKEI